MIQPTKYARKPFVVSAIEVTEENMKEVANWCKGKIQTEGELPHMKQYIHVPVRGLSSERQTKAYVGDRVLCSNPGNFKVYTARAFQNCFEEIQVAGVERDNLTQASKDEHGPANPVMARNPEVQANVTDVADPNQGELTAIDDYDSGIDVRPNQGGDVPVELLSTTTPVVNGGRVQED